MKLRKVVRPIIQSILAVIILISPLIPPKVVDLSSGINQSKEKSNKVMATNTYTATGGLLETGTEQSLSNANVGSWRGTMGDDNNYWDVARLNPGGLSQLLYFDGIQEYGANKLIVYMYAQNVSSANSFEHQICDWTSNSSVDYAADSNCTTGGWRILKPRNVTENPTSESNFVYEIYDGYFSTKSSSPGTVISTPISNFIRSSDDRVLIRSYSTNASTVVYRLDYAAVEMAIDSVYEPAAFVKTAGGTTTNYISDIVGNTGESSAGYGSDGSKLEIPQPGTSQAVDIYFVFKNIKTYTDMNTILVSSEICVSNTALTFGIYARNFTNSSWTQIGSTITGSACPTDTAYLSSFNSTAVGGFTFSNHISGSNEVWIRFLTNSPAATYNIQLDALYIMLGSVNSDSSYCGISWGSGTATNCVNTRDVINDVTSGTPSSANTSTWQITSEIEYPNLYHPLDNDDDANDNEYAMSSNLSFPITVHTGASVTGIHYSVRFRSNSTTITHEPQIRNYSGKIGQGGESSGSGWSDTTAVDSNALTTYSFEDSVDNRELLVSAADHINSTNNIGNIRMRTSASTNTTGGVTSDWDFAMMSIRWLEETNRITVQTQYAPTDGDVITGTSTSSNSSLLRSWRAASGNDGNYWNVTRDATNGMSYLLYFDGVQLRDANKLIVTLEQSNTTTNNTYSNQICDWVSSTSVDFAADSDCTGGGWRHLTPRKLDFSNTADVINQYEIYDGYFSTRSSTPGTPISTPLTNFVRSSDDRVMIRTYSTVGSSVNHKTDYALVEVAIDPVYEIADFVKTAGGTTVNYISDTIGAVGTNIYGSDNTKFQVPTPGSSQAADFYFVFKNVKKYTGMNTLLFIPEIAVSNTGLTWGVYIRDFSGGGSWKQAGGTVTATGTGDFEYATSFNSTTTSGFDINNSISSSGEVWVRILTNGPTASRTMSFDRIYMIAGSVNTDSALCEISWGTGTATDCTNTRDVINDIVSGTPSTANTSTWQATSAIEYPSGHYETDGDDDATNSEYAISQNLSFPITVGTGEAVTGIHYVLRGRSNVTSITRDINYLQYFGQPRFGGIGGGSGYRNTVSTDTNALTTYSFFDSWDLSEQQEVPELAINTSTNLANMRWRTSASTNVAGGVTSDWDFAMMSIRFIRDLTVEISISVTEGSVSYGAVAKGGAKTTIDLSDSQTISNDSNVPADFNIKGQNTACPWTLSGTAGNDTYEHQFCKKSDVSCSSPPTNYTDLTTSYQSAYTAVAVTGTKQIDLRIVLPTDTACTGSQSADVTIQAVES